MTKQNFFTEYALPITLIAICLIGGMVLGFFLRPLTETPVTCAPDTCTDTNTTTAVSPAFNLTMACSLGCAIDDAIVHVTNTPNSTEASVCMTSCTRYYFEGVHCQWEVNTIDASKATWTCFNSTQATQ